MKKFTYIVIALVAVGYMGFTAMPAQAASLPASQVLGSANASALKQTLDVLQTLLDLMKIRVADTANPLTEGQKIALSNVLGGMRTSLVGVSGTVASLEQKALAMESAKTIPVAAVSQVSDEPAPSDAGENVTGDGQVAGLSISDLQADKGGEESETAAVGGVFGKKGLLWGALILIVLVAGGIVFFRAVGKDEGTESAQVEEAQLPFAEMPEPPPAGIAEEREEAPVF